MITKKEIADILDEIGTLLELKGENPFKCRAYHNAARIVNSLTEDLNTLVDSGELENVKGIGDALFKKIAELVSTEKLKYYDELKNSLPQGLLTMLNVQGLGPKKVKYLYDKLNIQDLNQLKQAIAEHKLKDLNGFGEKTEENIMKGIEALDKYANKHLYPDAKKAADSLYEAISKQKGVIRCEIAGSLRRKKEIIGDIDILASVKKTAINRLMESFTKHPDVEKVISQGETKSSVLLKSGINCDLRVVSDSEYPFALNYFTGSKEHNVEMRSLAKQFGLSLNEYGFSEIGSKETRGRSKRIISAVNEEDIYRALKLSYIPPELRENNGEFEVARTNNLPQLIELRDIKGTFHCHSTYSDGANTLQQLSKAAIKIGWQYLGIADHSKSAAYAGGLDKVKLKLQFKEIEQLNKGFTNFRLLKGTETDILPDGGLDWENDTLKEFDFVVASIHSKFNMTEAEATKRTIKAIKNKYTTMIGHPTGRLLLERDGYPINMIEVINAASDYGKSIEINAHPQRLDLDWRYCRYAKEKGVKVFINPDAHSLDGLMDVIYGVGTARKGWLENSDIINTMSLTKILNYLRIN